MTRFSNTTPNGRDFNPGLLEHKASINFSLIATSLFLKLSLFTFTFFILLS